MSRIEIAIRSLLTVFLIWAVVSLTGQLFNEPFYGQLDGSAATLVAAICQIGLVLVGGAYAFWGCGYLLRGAYGIDEKLAPNDRNRLLAQVLRLTMVAAGLLLLPRAIPGVMALLSFFWGCFDILETVVVRGEAWGADRAVAWWLGQINDLLVAALAIYLLCGAPHFVRWRLARLGSRETDSQNEDTSEGSDNE
jgi:hypothetical protein